MKYVLNCTLQMLLKASVMGCDVERARADIIKSITASMMAPEASEACMAPEWVAALSYMPMKSIEDLFKYNPFMLFVYINTAFVNKTQFYKAIADFKQSGK